MWYLDWLDLTVFIGMLIISAFIGVYFAYFAKEKQNTISNYLMGGRTMSVLPVSFSLIASYISGISILGLPAEMYVYGTQYSMIVLSEVLVSITMVYVYLPVFYKLQITSSYEMLYIPIVIYVPALAFNQVTGINLYWITPIVCIICIFYTTLGGIKAVVWTDTFQIIIMMLGIIIVLVIGLFRIGGFHTVYERATASNRLEFLNLDPNLRTRHTFWSVVCGNYFNWLATCSTNQAMVQRYLSLSCRRKANIAAAILAFGITLIVILCCFTGLIIYAAYYDCDPIFTEKIKKADQLLPLFVMEIADKVPGLPGIFLSGVFSAALSTMSTGLNSMTGVIYEDMIRPSLKIPPSEMKASFIMKIIVVIIGILCVGMVFVVEHLGMLIQAGKSLSGITAGSLLGVFTLGMFFPCANHKGALAGGLISLSLVAWISIGSQKEIALGNIVYPRKPISVVNCQHLLPNKTQIKFETNGLQFIKPFLLFEMSYMWYSLIGTLITIIIGIVVSYMTGFTDSERMNKDLFIPAVHGFLNKNKKKEYNELKTNFQTSKENENKN
ncbi:hypothetical protein PGB90_003457 [Kerria lacca]